VAAHMVDGMNGTDVTRDATSRVPDEKNLIRKHVVVVRT